MINEDVYYVRISKKAIVGEGHCPSRLLSKAPLEGSCQRS